MPKVSAGVLLYRRTGPAGLEVLLAHMGGPFFEAKEEGAWTLPKGEYGPDEEPLHAALREFEEELGQPVPAHVQVLDLGTVRQSSGKVVTAFAVEGDLDATSVVSNTFEMEWPRGSGRTITVPEIDRAAWFGVEVARRVMIAAQADFLDRLVEALAGGG